MKILFLSIFVIALNDGYSQEKNLIVDFSTGAGFVCWQSIVTKDYYQIGDKKSISKSYLGYNLPFKIGLLIKNNKYSYGFGFSYESLGIKDIEKDNNASHYTITKIFLQGEYLFKDHDKYSYGINMQLGKFFNDDISLGNYEYFISTGLIIQYPLKDKYIIYFKPEYELKYYNVNFEGREPWPSTYYVKIDGNHFIHHVNANIGFRFII